LPALTPASDRKEVSKSSVATESNGSDCTDWVDGVRLEISCRSKVERMNELTEKKVRSIYEELQRCLSQILSTLHRHQDAQHDKTPA